MIPALLVAVLVGFVQESGQVLSTAVGPGFSTNAEIAGRAGWLITGVGRRARETAPTPEGAPRPVAVVHRKRGSVWERHQVLEAHVPDTLDARLVDCDGQVAIVAMRSALLIFERAEDAWTLAPGPESDDGVSVRELRAAAVGDGVILLGMPDEPKTFGSVLVFERGVEGWGTTTRLGGSDSWFGFGASVAVARETIAIGVAGHPGALQEPGSVHVYAREREGWARVQMLRAPAGSSGVREPETVRDAFGESLAMRGGVLVVGAGEAPATSGAGRAFVHRRTEGTWELEAVLESAAVSTGLGGMRVATDGRRVAVAAETLGLGRRIQVFERSGEGTAEPRGPQSWLPGPVHENSSPPSKVGFALTDSDLLLAIVPRPSAEGADVPFVQVVDGPP